MSLVFTYKVSYFSPVAKIIPEYKNARTGLYVPVRVVCWLMVFLYGLLDNALLFCRAAGCSGGLSAGDLYGLFEALVLHFVVSGANQGATVVVCVGYPLCLCSG